MSHLYLVGLGLNPKAFSEEAVEVISGCERVFREAYTSPIPGLDGEVLHGRLAVEVEQLGRGPVEDASVLMDALSTGDVALLVPGDPMISTTHISLRVEAAERGHDSSIIHSSSIMSAAIGESCLTATKFGRMATISFMKSRQPYHVLALNSEMGLHTLFLLDVDEEDGKYMSVRQALESLLEVEEDEGGSVIALDTLAIGMARISCGDQVIEAGKVKHLLGHDFGAPPHCLVVPGELHFSEREAMDALLG